MQPNEDTESFYRRVATFDGFASLMDPTLYRALPEDWAIGTADIVDSTGAIAEGRYKAVNMAGAAAIAAVKNALGRKDFPFVFGGDGASFAVAPADRDGAEGALAATAAWVDAQLGLTMRVALVPVAAIRAAGLDVRVARFAASPHVAYAMFAGGGVGWAEAAMKRGEFGIAPAPAGAEPDLTGLSCRFEPIASRRGVILSVLVLPAASAEDPRFRALIESLIAFVETSPDAGRPVPAEGPGLRWPSTGSDYEAKAQPGGGSLRNRITVLARTLFVFTILRLNIRLGRFVPERYLQEVVANSDFRKFDDGLRMILDCTADLADEIERRLQAAMQDGVARFGLSRQDAALMTCFTPSAMESDHVHFVDGAQGGYASAALALKTLPA